MAPAAERRPARRSRSFTGEHPVIFADGRPARPSDPLAADGLFDRTRAACAMVADRASQVTIDEGALARLASELGPPPPLLPEERPVGADEEDVALQVLAWNAVNFGSGWFPLVAKRPGLSGARSMAAALGDHVAAHGPPTAVWLAEADAARCAEVFDQPFPGPVDDLLELYAQSWRDLAALLLDHGGAAATFVHACGRSAARLVSSLAAMPLARDVATYDGEPVPLLKRAQITASHLARATGGQGLGQFDDIDRLTAFADNLVPHTLRMAGVLRYDEALAARISSGDLLTPGEPAEVEIRACGAHAVELLAARVDQPPAAVDLQLWQRGQSPEVKAQPRHRCRTSWY
jgi:Potential Queuosine, Q, salvage protein family